MTVPVQYAEVIVNKSIQAVNRVFHYRIPERLREKVGIGSVVSVPFGRECLEGVVVGFTGRSDVRDIKEIRGLVSQVPLFHQAMVDLAAWMADYYLCPRAAAFNAMLPAGLKLSLPRVGAKMVPTVFFTGNPDKISPEALTSAPRQQALLAYLKTHNGSLVSEVLRATGAPRSSLQALVKKGFVKIVDREVFRDPYSGEVFSVEIPKKLSLEQQTAVRMINEEFAGNRRPVLLHGVTGSGKTEVYLKAIETAISTGKQSIVMVPEIALTPQMVAVFKTRLGAQVAVFHSGLSEGERRDAWIQAAQGRIKVVVGARSAVFAPCRNLGLIILDEEHEPSYKQENVPRFHAREVAIKRARLQGALLVLGSATPSVESYYRAINGEFRLAEMKDRVLHRPLPRVQVVDMRQELKQGNRSIFSTVLQEKIHRRLEEKEQVMLFLNRRGFHTFVSCRTCGYVAACPHCAISLTHHARGNRMRCHFCGFSVTAPSVCPECGSTAIRHFGTGTQRVEEEVCRLFPGARVARVDTDTMTAKGSYDRVYRQVRAGNIDVLVGTQMIAKGLDFPNVTLVGVISADTLLHLPEMRAGERTFQLLTQVAGRAGRGNVPGEVVLQTYSPENPAVVAAARQDYLEFYQGEIAARQSSHYPPFGFFIRIIFSGKELMVVERNIHTVALCIRQELAEDDHLLGPAPAPVERIKDKFRFQMVVKGRELSRLRKAVSRGLERAGWERMDRKGVQVAIDVEPVNMM